MSNPAKSSDFGAEGHTASVTDWHELLQLTAPDDTCGVVFVRGQFPNTPDAILARAQRRDESGNKGTFGTRLQNAESESSVQLGERLAQGWINLRWPYTKYVLRQKDGDDDGTSGTYEQISFVRDGVLVQAIRLRWGNESSLSDYDSTDVMEKKTARLKVGGIVQFGCPCSNRGPADADTFSLNAGNGLDCVSDRYQKRLEMHLFIDGIRQDLSAPLHGVGHDEVSGTEVNTSSVHEIEFRDGEPVIIVSTYALQSLDSQSSGLDMATFTDLEDHLGTCNTSVNMTDRLWTATCSTNYEASEAVDVCVVGRCVEHIIGVSSIPFQRRETQNKRASASHPEFEEIALLRNVMTPQYVDVQSSL